jgi:hypothetical protein
VKRVALAIFIAAVTGSGCGLDIVGPAKSEPEVVDTPNLPAQESTSPGEVGVDAAVRPPSVLTVTKATAPAVVDLSAEGTIDWVHWTEEHNRKAGANVIGEYRYVPDLLEPNEGSGTTTTFKWNDGTEKKKGERRSYEYISGAGTVRATLQLPASTTKRTARFYLGGLRSTLRFEVSLSDGSAPPPPALEISDEGGALTQFVVEYSALRDGAQLEVAYTLVEARSLDASLRMGAVTLQ